MKVTHLKSNSEIEVIVEAVNEVDYNFITEEEYFFDWKKERRNEVFKLKFPDQNEILGLVSIKYYLTESRIEIVLIAVSCQNKGRNKVYEGIGGNLIAFVCRKAVELFGANAVVSLLAKTQLKKYYIEKYGMEDAGRQVFLFEDSLKKILNTYGKEEDGG